MLQSKLAHHSFSILRKLAGNTGQLPDSYMVNQGADYQVDECIFACGGFADLRKGTLAKRAVAVKTIRIAQDMDISKIRKVGFTVFALVPPACINPISGFLQGICALDAHFTR